MDGDRHEDPNQRSDSKGGCGKLAVGCGVVAVLLAAVVGYGIYKAPELLRWGMAKAVTAMIEGVVEESLQLPPEEQAAVMRPVDAYAQRVADGEVDGEVAMATLQGLLESNESAAVVIRGFEHRYLSAEAFPESEAEAETLTANRFAHGLLEDRIPRSHLEPLADIAVEEYTDEQGQQQYRIKDPLSDEEVAEALALMQTAVDEAGIEEPYRELDLEALVQQAIDRAHAQAVSGGALDEGSEDAAPGAEEEPATGEEPVEAL